jgi:hypothetical protein
LGKPIVKARSGNTQPAGSFPRAKQRLVVHRATRLPLSRCPYRESSGDGPADHPGPYFMDHFSLTGRDRIPLARGAIACDTFGGRMWYFQTRASVRSCRWTG